jgi:hypothetical protein
MFIPAHISQAPAFVQLQQASVPQFAQQLQQQALPPI